MSVNNKGQLTTSIPKDCKNYSPDKSKPTSVVCASLGVLYECKNHKGEREGCLFCENCATQSPVVPEPNKPSMDKESLDIIQKIAEDTYYESIRCYTADYTDADDSKEMIEGISDGITKAINLINADLEKKQKARIEHALKAQAETIEAYEEKLEKANPFLDNAEFITSAINAYWSEAVQKLQRKDLGDLERLQYELQLRKSEEIMAILLKP